MKFRPKGRKIYRKKSKYERVQAFKSNTSAVVFTILGMVVLLFVGFSIGGPVIRFSQESHILAVPVEVEETIPPTETEPATEAETPPEETQPPTDPKPEVPEIRGCMLDISTLLTQSALDEAMTQIPAETTHVLVPLKAQGGEIYFATAMADAARGGAVKAAVPLESIYETIASKGFIPVAVIHTLDDTIYPQIHAEAAYHCETGEVWLDAKGLPHLSPFSEMAVDYLGNLAAEANQAGFRTILCDGLQFPAFTEEDQARLESRATQEGRYTALTGVIERMQREAPHTDFYVLLDGTGILAGRTEGLSATESLKLTAVVMRLDEMSAANCETLRTLTEHNATLFLWDGVPLPENEHSYLIPLSQAPAAQAGEES
ncbi:MAG: hypothetical protein II916_02720 [Oscillospiraceae bacterium]|nr:hypothetical protein [Oscillospiraceae bacterium]